jgi:hypothetical protein
MTTMRIEKINIKDLEETITNSTPLLALVGAGDFAFEKIRAVRIELADRAGSFDPKAVRGHAQTSFAGRVEALQSELMTAPERIQALPEKAQEWPTKAQSILADVLSTAFSTYGELAGRGKTRVSQVLRETPAVEVDIEVKPVSRPSTSTARKSTTAAKKKPAAKKTATKTTKTTKPAAKKSVTKQTTTKETTTKETPTATSTSAAGGTSN